VEKGERVHERHEIHERKGKIEERGEGRGERRETRGTDEWIEKTVVDGWKG